MRISKWTQRLLLRFLPRPPPLPPSGNSAPSSRRRDRALCAMNAPDCLGVIGSNGRRWSSLYTWLKGGLLDKQNIMESVRALGALLVSKLWLVATGALWNTTAIASPPPPLVSLALRPVLQLLQRPRGAHPKHVRDLQPATCPESWIKSAKLNLIC